MVSGIWNLLFGIWYIKSLLVSGVWYPETETRAWNLVPCISRGDFHAKSGVRGARNPHVHYTHVHCSEASSNITCKPLALLCRQVRTAGPGPKTIPARTCRVYMPCVDAAASPGLRPGGLQISLTALMRVLSTQSARQPRAQSSLASLQKKSKNSAFQMSS